MLAMQDHYFKAVGIRDVQMQINSLGCPKCRPGYREALVSFLEKRLNNLCEDCRRRYRNNPLRALDCKAKGCREATLDAPSVIDYLCPSCSKHFAKVQDYLRDMGVPFEVNHRMVRGLDYYTKTTFEMVTGSLGAQNAVAAGGRYDGLIKDLGGPPLPGIGFAIGMERLVLMKGKDHIQPPRPELFLAAVGEEAARRSFLLMSALQRRNISAEMDCEGKSLKAQLRRANKLRTRYVLILGEDEIARQTAQLKNMDTGTQEEIALKSLEASLPDMLATS
jgi:histidyl-tRNA synthetase